MQQQCQILYMFTGVVNAGRDWTSNGVITPTFIVQYVIHTVKHLQENNTDYVQQ